MEILKNKGWQKSTSPQLSIEFKITPATQELDQEIEFNKILELEECACHKGDDLCEKCLSILPVEEHFQCVGFDKLLKSIPIKECQHEQFLIIEGHMNWATYNDIMNNDYDDASDFTIDHYYYPYKLSRKNFEFLMKDNQMSKNKSKYPILESEALDALLRNQEGWHTIQTGPELKTVKFDYSNQEMIAEVIADLIDSGLDEDAHFRSKFIMSDSLKPSDFRDFITDIDKLDVLMSMVRDHIILALKKVADDLEK